MKKEINVYIALSGGVDSAVSAALLQKQGYNCTGVFIRFVDNELSRVGLNNAANVANKLNIPFKIYDFRNEFKDRVIDYFIREYKSGRTPNPCVFCNSDIKFGLFLEKAIKDSADFISTGHYVRKVYNSKDKRFRLLKGIDSKKDQSYFLYRLNQKQLKYCLFPLGTYIKKQVTDLSKDFGLDLNKIKESQEICFIKNNDISKFLKKYIESKEGDIIDTTGNKLRKHNGYFLYTIGQRSGLQIGGGTPFYVVNINSKTNTLIVSRNETDLYRKSIDIANLSWIEGFQPKLPIKCETSIRYNHDPQKCQLLEFGNKYKIIFDCKQRAPTPGQSAVIYNKDECLGGGIII